MECRVCSDSLSALLDGELAAPERQSIEEHLRHCSDCSQEYDSLLYCVQLTDALGVGALDAPSFAGIEPRLKRAGGGFWDFSWLFSPAWATLTAALLLAISIPFIWDSRDEAAHLERQFAHFVEERDRLESLHHGIIAAEPVGWVTYNPFSLDRAPARTNPFSE